MFASGNITNTRLLTGFWALVLCVLPSAFVPVSAQVYAGMLAGTQSSSTFAAYAKHVGADPSTDRPLATFRLAHGYSVGFEMPGRIGIGGVLAFNYRHWRASSGFTHHVDGPVDYNLRINQYLVPIGFGKAEDGFALLGYFITGVGSVKIEKQWLSVPDRNRIYRGRQLCYGLGGSVVWAKRTLGWMARLQWVGNMLPGYENRTNLFDRSYFDDNANSVDPYLLQYPSNGGIRNVKADFRGVSLELGIFLKLMNWGW